MKTICLILAIFFTLGTIGNITKDIQVAVFGAICAAVCWLLWILLSRRSKAVSPATNTQRNTQQTAKYTHIHIHVAGVTYRNDDGTDRQQLLRKIKFGDSPFEDKANLDVQLKSYHYEGQPAIRVMVNGYQIGNVPKEQVADVQIALTKPGATISVFDVKGGGTVNGEKLNYGALIVIQYKK